MSFPDLASDLDLTERPLPLPNAAFSAAVLSGGDSPSFFSSEAEKFRKLSSFRNFALLYVQRDRRRMHD